MNIESLYTGALNWDYEPGCEEGLSDEIEARLAELCSMRPVEHTLFLGNACAGPYVEIYGPIRRDVKYVGDRVEAYLRRRAGVRLL